MQTTPEIIFNIAPGSHRMRSIPNSSRISSAVKHMHHHIRESHPIHPIASQDEIPRYFRFIIDILFPILIFHSIVSNFNIKQLPQLWILPFLGFGAVLFGGIAGIVLRRGVKTDNENIRKTFHHFCAINNTPIWR